MSKLLTDSKTLMDWMEDFNGDSKLQSMIDSLKEAVINNTELQITITDNKAINKLQSDNQSIVYVLRELQNLKNDFGDMTTA